MKTICILVLSLCFLIVGCDRQPRLKVSMTRTSGNDALFILGAQPFVFDIDYKGTATTAYISIQAFKDGKLTLPYLEIGGCGFTEPMSNLKLKINVNIFDSRTSVMKLAPGTKIEGDFFRIVSDVKDRNSEVSGGNTIVSTNQMEMGGMQTWGAIYKPDLAKELIPIGYFKSKKTGGIMVGGDSEELLKSDPDCDLIIFYLKINRQVTLGVSGSH
jgi:hypothetical protein